ncbi:DUF3783 domain-containing protein [Clostridium omnivorum]|uniref:DUF3783 domain-containing protein n=1 Tax=Clostridium omnivorum TaxID=1604902 RepID=A0ABQ5N546_9CLOT|nr:DUF3783 domain-containing protein [Clostridium sp. E14]GLC30337.1 hypothetical protein bsdE14_17470 [Clostridium sp. E14]
MVLNNNKLILFYGLSAEDKTFLQQVISENSLPACKEIERDMARMKLKDIIAGLKFEIYTEVLPEEKIILFNNLSDEELDKAIKSIKKNQDMKPILAVITPTSIDWEFKYLLEHLIEEREWHLRNK